MQFPTAVFSGALFAPRRAEHGATVFSWIDRDLAAASAEIEGWTRLTLHSEDPLLSHELPDADGHYYHYLLRRSRERFLLLSTSTELVEVLMKRTGHSAKTLSPSIDVPRIVRELADKPEAYVMSAAWARVDGYGQALRTIVMYGTDLAEAKLFRSMLSEIVPYRVTVRNIRTHHDALTIGSRGEVAFHYRGTISLQEVDQALRFLSAQKYLHWDDMQVQE